jgi:hypothetical protein
MKVLQWLLLLIIIYSFFVIKPAMAIYDPTTVTNNKFGIHILYPSELSEAAHLVNSTGGDWGYVTIPIQASDKDLVKWQDFMDNCIRFHLIPIIRIATTGDYFVSGAWSKPNSYDIIDFANFLNDLNWPTKNRYVIIFNEPNRGDEWGGTPNAAEYAQILNFSVDIFKQRSQDFFIIAAGLDNASVNIINTSIDDYSYMYQMEQTVPGIFAKIDGLASHSYPNPGFSKPPSLLREGIYSFYYQQKLAENFSGKILPVFITETGWSADKVSQETQSQYYIQSFTNYWNDSNVVAVTPFIFNAAQGPFAQFSFINNGNKNKIYYAFFNFKKNKGAPNLNPIALAITKVNSNFPTEHFKSTSLQNIFKHIGNSQKTFFKWLLGI